MYRIEKKHIKYLKNGIEIRPAKVGEEYEIGDWPESYSIIKMGYRLPLREATYSDIMYVMTYNKCIIGYFMAYTEINMSNKEYLPMQSKELIIYDFAVSARAYVKYSKILFDYIIKYANYNGYKAISIKKLDAYSYFSDFLLRHYNVLAFNDVLYLPIKNPRIKSCQKYLSVCKNERISLEDLYFLYGLKFDILKTKCILKLTANDHIIVDRTTGEISFPNKVKLLKDEVIINKFTRDLIHLVISIFNETENETLNVNFSNENPYYFEASFNNRIYISRDVNAVLDDIEYVLKNSNLGYDEISPYTIEYDMNEKSYRDSYVILKTKEVIKKYAEYADINNLPLPEKLKMKKKALGFNEKLKTIKNFKLAMGTPFCGIRKIFIDLTNDVSLKSNINKVENINLSKEEIINELSMFYFSNWKELYNDNPKPDEERIWTITLTFENEIIEYHGIDSYPKVWPLVEKFYNKYVKFTESFE